MSNANSASSTGPDGQPTGAPRYSRVIDAHMHWYPQAFVDLMIKKGPAHGAVMGEDEKGPVVISVPGSTQTSSMRRTMTDTDAIIPASTDRDSHWDFRIAESLNR